MGLSHAVVDRPTCSHASFGTIGKQLHHDLASRPPESLAMSPGINARVEVVTVNVHDGEARDVERGVNGFANCIAVVKMTSFPDCFQRVSYKAVSRTETESKEKIKGRRKCAKKKKMKLK